MSDPHRYDQPRYSYGSSSDKLLKLHKLAIQRYMSIPKADTRDIALLERVEILLALSISHRTIGKILSGELELAEDGNVVKTIEEATIKESHVDEQKRNWIPTPKFKVGDQIRFANDPTAMPCRVAFITWDTHVKDWRYWPTFVGNRNETCLGVNNAPFELEAVLIKTYEL